MTDTHHTWNTGKPLHTRKQLCGCHIKAKTAKTPEIFNLCMEGQQNKKAADEGYRLWMANKDLCIDAKIKRAIHRGFVVHRDAYIRHLRTGKTWVL